MNLKSKLSIRFLLFSLLFLSYFSVYAEDKTISLSESNVKTQTTNESLDKPAKIVRVGFFENKSFMEKNHVTGIRSGYAIEYLNELKKYTDWEYEYVDATWSQLYEMLLNGEIDFLPGLSFTNERNTQLSFPYEKMGTEAYYIYKKIGNHRISANDETSLKDKKVGITRNTLLYENYLSWMDSNHIHSLILFYDENEEKKQALIAGKVDAICETSNNIKANSGIVPVFQIGYSFYYLGVAKNQPELLNELNVVLYKIEHDNPTFRNSLQRKYFSDSAINEAITNYSKTNFQRSMDFLKDNIQWTLGVSFGIILILLTFICVYFYLNKRKKEIQKKDQIIINQQMEILQSLTDIYLTTHIFNLKTDTLKIVKSIKEIDTYEKIEKANEGLKNAMKDRTTEPFLEHVLTFCNLETLPERLKDKNSISTEFIGKYSGWCRLNFITLNKDENNLPVEVLFTVEVIEEEKANEEYLKRLSIIDSLTGLENRNSYESTIITLDLKKDYSRTIFVMDLDGLKNTNDKYGHDAGDEIIVGAASIIKMVFGTTGQCYRLGGDEFCVIISAEKADIDKMCQEFNLLVDNWKGNKVDSLHISYGFVSTYEYSDYSIRDLFKIADTRMYDAKRNYYETTNQDRRFSSRKN